MTPRSLLWFWKGLMGHSVTFALLFGSVLLGASLARGVHRLLSTLGFHWLYVIVIPFLLFRWMARQEPRWIPDEKRRRFIALSILAGSIALSSVIGWLRGNPAANPGGAPRTHSGGRPSLGRRSGSA